MGKSLIIKGGNFAPNGIPDLSVFTDISSSIVKSSTGRLYVHYPHNSANEQFTLSNQSPNCICTIDVSSYVGKRIKLYSSDAAEPSAYEGGIWYKCFASSVAVTLPWTGNSNAPNALVAVEHIASFGGSGVMATWDLVVPTGAVYLVFTLNTSVTNEPKVYVETSE